MKSLTSILCLFLISISFAQTKQFEPSVIDFPNLSPEHLAKFQKESDEFYRLVENDVSFESLTPAQQEIYKNEMLYEAGPYSTEELGCSWYCAAGPSNIESSSALTNTKTNIYEAGMVHDFDLRTAWVEGKEDYGIGEEITIEFELADILKITHLEIYNGYCKSEQTWQDNSRVKEFGMYVNGKLYGKLKLQDSYKKQRFDVGILGAYPTGKLQLTLKILEVYPGDKYKDTAISEINFDGTGDH